MIRLAFSSVACPSWTLERVARAAAEYGYQGVELRSLAAGVAGGGGGPESAAFASEPAMTSGEKTRRIFADRGIDVCSVATGVRFDEVVFPPVIGHALGFFDRPVRELKAYIDVAAQAGAEHVRVFAFEAPEQSRRGKKAGRKRIVERLRLAADACHKTGVRLVIENGGDFPTGADLAGLIAEVNFPDVGACYGVLPAWEAGENFAEGVAALGNHLAIARVQDVDDAGRPVVIGSGMRPCRRFVTALNEAKSLSWLVVEWDAAWVAPGAAPGAVGAPGPESVLPASAAAIVPWLAAAPIRRGMARAAR